MKIFGILFVNVYFHFIALQNYVTKLAHKLLTIPGLRLQRQASADVIVCFISFNEKARLSRVAEAL